MNRESEPSGDNLQDDRTKRHEDLRRRVQARLALRLREKRERPPAKPPRFDEVFWKGVAWLDTL